MPRECGRQTSPIFQGGRCTGLRSWEVLRSGYSLWERKSVYSLRPAPGLWYLQAEKEAGAFQNGPIGIRGLRWCQGQSEKQPMCMYFMRMHADIRARSVYPHMSLRPPTCLHACVCTCIAGKREQRAGLGLAGPEDWLPVDFPNLSTEGVPSLHHRAQGWQ